jgi:uncharacterized protein (TIGR03437 family)
MPAVRFLLAALAFGSSLWADTSAPNTGPTYSGSSIVNAADNLPGSLAPNTLATMYGTGLAYTTKALSSSDFQGGLLPTVLPGTGVRVLVGGLAANIYYVSPTQINFLVPSILLPGTVTVQLALDGLAGPAVQVQLAAASPALFQQDTQNVIATRADGTVITPANPANAGDYVVLYATGLGQTTPPIGYAEVPARATPIADTADFQVLLNGAPLASQYIAYAGVSPGFGGLYQINLKLPASVSGGSEIRISQAGLTSPPGLTLPISQ